MATQGKLMVLGATADQAPLIAKARALGYETLVIDAQDADLDSRVALLERARPEAVRGVVTCGAAGLVATAAWISDRSP